MAQFEREILSLEAATFDFENEKDPKTVYVVLLAVRALILIARILMENHNDS